MLVVLQEDETSLSLQVCIRLRCNKGVNTSQLSEKLLHDKDIEAEFEGFEVEDIHRLLQRGGETVPSVNDVQHWLEEQEDDDFRVLGDD